MEASLESAQLMLVALLCIGMALYEIRDNSIAVVAIASMLIKFAILPIMMNYKIDLYIVGAVALVPLSRIIEYAKKKFDGDNIEDNKRDRNNTRH